MIPWKVIATVASITALGLVSLAVGQYLLAAGAGGALFSYLGRLNGAASTNSTP